jgi:hypothetical protein
MARPVSWLPRLHELRRSVGDSVRSHYDCEQIGRLFQIQPRSAQMLMGLMPTVTIGASALVERQALSALLDRIAAADDPAAELASLRAQGKPPAVRRSLRELVQTDFDADLSSTPAGMLLERGLLTARFESLADLASMLQWLAQVMDEDLEGFAARYEPVRELDRVEAQQREADQADAAFITEWLAAHPTR